MIKSCWRQFNDIFTILKYNSENKPSCPVSDVCAKPLSRQLILAAFFCGVRLMQFIGLALYVVLPIY